MSALRQWCGEAIDRALAEKRELGCQADDIVDAFAALWTAGPISNGTAVPIPARPALDAYGLRMEMMA